MFHFTIWQFIKLMFSYLWFLDIDNIFHKQRTSNISQQGNAENYNLFKSFKMFASKRILKSCNTDKWVEKCFSQFNLISSIRNSVYVVKRKMEKFLF